MTIAHLQNKRLGRYLALAAAACAVLGASLQAEEIIAISSKTSKDYVRRTLPDGTFATETYVFGKGDNLGGARVDPTTDKLDFMTVARTIAVPLAEKRYVPTGDPKTTNLLIMVYWGTTMAPEDAMGTPSHEELRTATVARDRAALALKDASNNAEKHAAIQMLNVANNQMMTDLSEIQSENQARENTDMRTATLLGYDSWWVAVNSAMDGSPLGRRKKDMEAELEEDRYFVVLSAFDYQALVKQKKNKFLWEVRFSIREHGNAFDEKLPSMLAKASDYFGKNSNGLQHEDLPIGKVEIGPVKSLGVVNQ